MSATRRRAGCSCVSEKAILHLYTDDHGPCVVVGIDEHGNEFIETARIRTAKVRCERCHFINLQKIPAP